MGYTVQENLQPELIFSKVLRSLMKEKKVTQVQLAKAMKVSQAAVSKWTNGALPDSAKIIEVSRYFNVPIDLLIGTEVSKSKTPNSIQNREAQQAYNPTEYISLLGCEKLKKRDAARALFKMEEFHASLVSATNALGEIINIFRQN